jgi:glycosyltransferase involved in cell wall biosynthesis
MRVSMFVYNTFEHDARVLREAEALAAAGHPTRVIALRGPGADPRERVGEIEVVRVEADPLPAKAARLAVGAARKVRRPRSAGLAPAPIGSVGDSAAGSDVGRRLLRVHLDRTHDLFRRRAAAVAAEAPAQVWFAHDLDTLEVAAAARTRHGGRLVYDSHELWLERRFLPPLSTAARQRWQQTETRLIRTADVRLTVSEPLADELARRYGVERPAVVRNLPSRADLGRAEGTGVRQRLQLPADRPVAVYVGGLAPDRGIEELVGAAARVDGLEVVLVGPGPDHYADRLRALASQAGVGERVHLLPAVPPGDVVAAAAGGDVGIVANLHSGLNHRYTVPNRLYTCLAAGVPIVGNHSPAFEPIIRDNEVGVTCDVRDPDELANAIGFVLDPANHDRLRANALAFSEQETWEREAARLVELIEEVA